MALLSDGETLFVDLRDSAELQRDGKIPSAVHVNRGMLEFVTDPTLPYHNPIFSSGKKSSFIVLVAGRSALAADTAQQMGLEIERNQKEMMAQLGPSEKELEQMRSEIEKSWKSRQKDIDKMTHELAESTRPTQKEMEQLRSEIQKSMPTQKDFDEMKRQVQQSMPTQQQLDDMKRQALASMPSQKDMDEMRRQIESSSKEWTPKLQQQMEELKKQMEQQKLDFQKMLQEFNSDREF